MQKLNKMLLIALITFLSSCGSTPESIEFNQKTVYLVLIEEDGRRYIDEKESACFLRRYHWGADFIGKVSEVSELDIIKCNKIIGSSPKNYAKKITWLEQLRLLFNNANQ